MHSAPDRSSRRPLLVALLVVLVVAGAAGVVALTRGGGPATRHRPRPTRARRAVAGNLAGAARTSATAEPTTRHAQPDEPGLRQLGLPAPAGPRRRGQAGAHRAGPARRHRARPADRRGLGGRHRGPPHVGQLHPEARARHLAAGAVPGRRDRPGRDRAAAAGRDARRLRRRRRRRALGPVRRRLAAAPLPRPVRDDRGDVRARLPAALGVHQGLGPGPAPAHDLRADPDRPGRPGVPGAGDAHAPARSSTGVSGRPGRRSSPGRRTAGRSSRTPGPSTGAPARSGSPATASGTWSR